MRRYAVLVLEPAPLWPIGADVVRCGDVDRLRRELDSARPWSAVVARAGHPAVDRDLIGLAGRRGVPVIEVGRAPGPATPLGATSVADPAGIDDALDLVARGHPGGRTPVDAGALGAVLGTLIESGGDGDDGRLGRLVAVCGTGGCGTSRLAMALAQGLVRRGLGRRHHPGGGTVPWGLVLVDLSLRPGLAVLHHTGAGDLDVLVDLHRRGCPSVDDVRAVSRAVGDRGYRLVTGLGAPAHWQGIGRFSFDATLDGLRSAFAVVVADVSGELDGEAETGSEGIGDRNHMARRVTADADLVVAVGRGGPTGRLALDHLVHALARPDGVRPVLPVRIAPSPSGSVGGCFVVGDPAVAGFERTCAPVVDAAHRWLGTAVARRLARGPVRIEPGRRGAP